MCIYKKEINKKNKTKNLIPSVFVLAVKFIFFKILSTFRGIFYSKQKTDDITTKTINKASTKRFSPEQSSHWEIDIHLKRTTRGGELFREIK